MFHLGNNIAAIRFGIAAVRRRRMLPGVGFRVHIRQTRLKRSPLIAAQQGDGSQMPEDELLKRRTAVRGKRAKSSAEADSMPDLAFDPIEAALRQLHATVASEEIPADFLDLLDQLEERQPSE